MKQFLAIYIFVLLAACTNQQDPDPSMVGWDYYPLEIGFFNEYEALHVKFTLGVPDSVEYQLRSVIADSFENQSGTTSYIMYRYTRPESTADWEYLDTWTLRRDPGRLVVYEENIPYLKLSFPVRNALSWDGNSLNVGPEDEYTLTHLDAPVLLPDGVPKDGLTVIQEDFFDAVIGEEDRRKEQYARDAGMILRESRQLTYCLQGGCAGSTLPQSGTIDLLILSDYGYAR